MKSLEKISCKLSTTLKPYMPLIGPLASCFTVGQFLAESLICLDIFARRSTRGVPSWPFVGGFVIGTLMLKYSLMIEDFSMFVVNFTGVLLNLINIIIYNKFCRRRRRELHEPLKKGLIFVALMFLYSFWEKEEFLGYRYAVIVTILMLVVNGSPLLEMNDIIECEDASKIQFPLTVTTCMSCLLWLLYGFIIRSDFIVLSEALKSLKKVTLLLKSASDNLSIVFWCWGLSYLVRSTTNAKVFPVFINLNMSKIPSTLEFNSKVQNFIGFLLSFIQSALYINYYDGLFGKTS